MTIIVGLVTSFAGSMLSLIVWFHYDLDGWWEHKRHARMIRRGQKKERL